jgi:23S rRNA U2552 (ribose-2'-O)-methylase RlmE/FtsJ
MAFQDKFGLLLLEEMQNIEDPLSIIFKKEGKSSKYHRSSKSIENDAKRITTAWEIMDEKSDEKKKEIMRLTRYYKKIKTSKLNKGGLAKEVTEISGATFVTQAWLKMYEIMNTFELFDKKKRTVKTFHLCEAPGAFILAINHYLKTKTPVDNFDWYAQSLNPNSKKIVSEYGRVFGSGDPTGLLNQYPDRWIWGKDGTGDITKPENIISYKKHCENIDFMTIDCGVGHVRDANPVTYAQIVFLLTNLPKGKNFVMKMFQPFLPKIKISLYYLLYKHFEVLHFYKPLQNQISSEFYVIGINYDPISKKEKIKMLKFMRKFNPDKGFIKKIPESFVKQLELASQKLTDQYVHEIERQIYYIDNLEYIDDKHRELLEKAKEERNIDWIHRFKIKRIKDIDKLV